MQFKVSTNKILNTYLLTAACCFLAACSDNSEQDTITYNLPDVVDFNFHIKPLLSDNCFFCHGPDISNAKAGMSLNTFKLATQHVTESGKHPIVPGNLKESEVILRITSDDESFMMPPPDSNLRLSDRDKAMIKKWVRQGAEYKKHWAFISPIKPSIPSLSHSALINSALTTPESSHAEWISNPIDSFILQQLTNNKLSPTKEADKETLIRRVTFDLTGLPPTLEEIDNFLSDKNDNAYETVVKRLLHSPAYGERMAVEWLDVARYADTFGYSVDYYRDASPYRDWVIKTFNNNLPFDTFISWQLAGDLYPNPTQEQRLATAFNRLHAQNGEGGIVNEEFRVEYIKDRVQTFSTGLLGLTMHCAQCHDHKYDAISTKDYYETFAMFNNIDESGQISWDANDIPVPTMMMPTDEQSSTLAALDKKIISASQSLEKSSGLSTKFQQWIKSKQGKPVDFKASDALSAYYPLSSTDNNDKILSALDKKIQGKVLYGSDLNKKVGPKIVHVKEENRDAILLNGDDPLYFPNENNFDRATPFTIGIDVKFPNEFNNGVLIHYNKASILYNFKGFDISVKDNFWSVRLAHTYPYNAIELRSEKPIEKNTWLNIAMSYDGSSKANGIQFYVNGQPEKMTIERDNLYKDIKHSNESVLKEIGIKVGARWRGRGTPNTLVDNLKVWSRQLTHLELQSVTGASVNIDENINSLAFYNFRYNKDFRSNLSTLIKLRQQKNTLTEPIFEMMVMEELPEKRQAYILKRGSYSSHGEAVDPGVPEAIFPYDESLPKNRLGLAQWVTDPQHPLMPRVIINRYWMMFMGQGIVKTPEDFGNQGKLPTHPNLLDWLSREFVDSGWDVKHIIELIVNSSTYKQSSIAELNNAELDPENRLYSRGPSSRLTAEMLRDNALAASGLLVRKVGGKSVYPYQPDGLWRMNQAKYTQGSGDDLYRRSLYTIWKRSVPPPTMHNFDTPTRSYSVGTRQTTNTPLQALTLLNDPQYIEAARALAEQVIRSNENNNERLQRLYRLLTSQFPDKNELALLDQMYQHFFASFTKTPEKAKKLLSVGESNVDNSLDEIVVAAFTAVANLVMNHDATVIKR